MADTRKNNADPIVISLEANFHGVNNDSWEGKLIQFPKGGILWGLHLSKQKSEVGITSRIIGCLICFGPIKDHAPDWSITFDHVFTLYSKRVGSAGTIQKNTSLSGACPIINNYEWGDANSDLLDVFKNTENIRLSCHLYISETNGINREALKQTKRSREQTDEPVTASQVESQVMKCFSDMLVNEKIDFSNIAMDAMHKLSELFCFPRVIDVCRQYLIKNQTELLGSTSDFDNESDIYEEFNLTGFDYPANCETRRVRMGNLNEDDIIAMFQQLCSIAFTKAS
ncbi:hypothetical protein GCK72_024736 [Caenorhabditis remanei]|uniref:MATH domain-containing protein n=1 Tax=Caenorhabditis remanei TaxID=31234 RepID=A0A6A5G152_CAERE|nr:hypothetical protein GCK72_024736 [Caenorhabditis remanei]KAF1748269.1 hypothetical protein GCK72_024736 [Caenorhabditis remanei]